MKTRDLFFIRYALDFEIVKFIIYDLTNEKTLL